MNKIQDLPFQFQLVSSFFSGFAALMLMGKERLCNIDNLLLWAVNKQMRLEGGFQVVIVVKKLEV